ncbi:DNA starvation/stationary phase protection protein [Actinomadura rubrobrunea]|uniref:DNA starvation/stationary phase protection protein n=1 Tax=Actinomadura rubrobrunea TaxID=115335 RepID=A0A9W6PQH8_9ACTN|nr:DNA starvation/stationary phase protection protein [Actinomadura rubrobrunea]GLW62759.1 DNA starvation/stationary phase protection protein [Actinomadura rubrobrunea]
MATVKSPLNDEARKITAEALQGALIDLIDLSLFAKQAHWNLNGRNFKIVHEHLDEVVELARTYTDEVAERAIALGINPDGRVRTVADRTRIPQLEPGYVADDKVVAAVTDVLAQMIERFRERVRATDEPDPVTQDLLIQATRELEKQHWMFQAQV